MFMSYSVDIGEKADERKYSTLKTTTGVRLTFYEQPGTYLGFGEGVVKLGVGGTKSSSDVWGSRDF